ncbi:hypothetical protein [Lyticum sinuosum]|uniref:Uncharacterized protein n=1 Tax=Lyticum sinuosum TaxID=1332059 RepID=A0AAE5AHS2_9RICK|nr:hypothetical protein [Lyticum sinuosum]MDZ5761478.1 hypothetical protein [Lyticum sinuosum]
MQNNQEPMQNNLTEKQKQHFLELYKMALGYKFLMENYKDQSINTDNEIDMLSATLFEYYYVIINMIYKINFNTATINDIERNIGISKDILIRTQEEVVRLNQNIITKNSVILQKQVNDLNAVLKIVKKFNDQKHMEDDVKYVIYHALKKLHPIRTFIKDKIKDITGIIISILLRPLKLIYEHIIKPIINIPSRIHKYFTSGNNKNSSISIDR